MSISPEREEDRLDRLSRRIEEWLADSSYRTETLRALVSEVRREQPLSVSRAEPAVAAGPGEALAAESLVRFARDLETSPDQASILGHLVRGAAGVASRALLFIVRGESVIGWDARGFSSDFAARSVSIPLAEAGLVARCRAECVAVVDPPPGDNAALLSKLGGASASRMMAAPLWVRDRVAAVLYADNGATPGRLRPEAVCLMATLAALNLEVLPVRLKHPRPAAEPELVVAEPDPPAPPAVEPDEPQAVSEPSIAPGPALSPEQEALSEDAGRFARLLASEIVLYNASELEEGRRNKDIYQRLRDEIDRSHQMFLERFPATEPGTEECFRNELVRILAGGDQSAITLPWS